MEGVTFNFLFTLLFLPSSTGLQSSFLKVTLFCVKFRSSETLYKDFFSYGFYIIVDVDNRLTTFYDMYVYIYSYIFLRVYVE